MLSMNAHPSLPTTNSIHSESISSRHRLQPLTLLQPNTNALPNPTKNAAFLSNRSPFHQCLSRHCVMPLWQRQLVNFQFKLPNHFVSDIANAHNARIQSSYATINHDNCPYKRLLHIRLFDLAESTHVEWDSEYFTLKINGKAIQNTEQKKSKKKKENTKTFRFVQPLDISAHAKSVMNFEIQCYKNVFLGAASIEIVNLLTLTHLTLTVLRRSELAQILNTFTHKSVDHCCKICGERQNLSRCSRCKAAWYCSLKHQQQDWNNHVLGCKSFEELKKLRLKHKKKTNIESEDIVCNEIKVSVRDPLSLCRIRDPVRGIHCCHPQCVDLSTFLNYSYNTKTWQCPICVQPLKYEDLVIDVSMKRIINEITDDIDQVRLNPDDYSYKIITLEEQQKTDGHLNENGKEAKQSKKRKQSTSMDCEETTNGNGRPSKKRSRIGTQSNDARSTQKNVDVIVLD